MPSSRRRSPARLPGPRRASPKPAVLAVPGPQTMEPSITRACRRESAAALRNAAWLQRPLCHQHPALCQQKPNESGPLCACAGGTCRLHLRAAQPSLPNLPGCGEVFQKGISTAGRSCCAVNLGIWLKPVKDGKFRANPLTSISMSSFMLPHKISQFSGTCAAMKVVPVLLWEELS